MVAILQFSRYFSDMETLEKNKELAQINSGIGWDDVRMSALERDGCEYTDQWDPELRSVDTNADHSQRPGTPNEHVGALLERWTQDVKNESLRIGNFAIGQTESPVDIQAA